MSKTNNHSGLLRPTLYAIRFADSKSQAYLVRDLSGTPVSNEVMLHGYQLSPITVPLEDAIALLEQYKTNQVLSGEWIFEIAPHGCPDCGRVIWANDPDFCYLEPGESTKWRAGCNIEDFGCGHEVHADSRNAVISAWNAPQVKA